MVENGNNKKEQQQQQRERERKTESFVINLSQRLIHTQIKRKRKNAYA